MEINRPSILILGLILTFSFSTVMSRYAFAENHLKEIMPGNVDSLKKLSLANGSTAVFLDNKRLALGLSQDNKIEIWDVTNGNLSVVLDKGGIEFTCAAFSPDGKLLASGWADKTVTIFQTGSWKLIQTLKGYNGCIFNVRFSSDGQLLATAEGDGGSSIKVWNVKDWTEVCTFAWTWIWPQDKLKLS